MVKKVQSVRTDMKEVVSGQSAIEAEMRETEALHDAMCAAIFVDPSHRYLIGLEGIRTLRPIISFASHFDHASLNLPPPTVMEELKYAAKGRSRGPKITLVEIAGLPEEMIDVGLYDFAMEEAGRKGGSMAVHFTLGLKG